jgi:hypothetical protein
MHSEDTRTIAEIFATLDDSQKNVVYAMLAHAVGGDDDVEQSDSSDSLEHDNEGDIFVALASNQGVNGQIITSPDGIEWTSKYKSDTTAYTSLVFGNGKYVLGSREGNPTLWSTDLVNWISSTNTPYVYDNFLGYGAGHFILMPKSTNGNRYIYVDGINWIADTTINNIRDTTLTSMCYANGLVVLAGSVAATRTRIITSVDGINLDWKLKGETPEQALAGMMAKHTVSIYDMCCDGLSHPIEMWDEKITDHINYLILLKTLVEEV